MIEIADLINESGIPAYHLADVYLSVTDSLDDSASNAN